MTARDRTPIVHAPGVLAIPLTRGLFALIDEADAPLVGHLVWTAMLTGGIAYAFRRGPRPRSECVLMHRALLSPGPGKVVDHIDGNGLNNRRGNIRVATQGENILAGRFRRNNKSGFRGVRCETREGVPCKRWIAETTLNSRPVRLGRFDTAEDAARAYDRFVLSTRGEFARTNFPREEYE